MRKLLLLSAGLALFAVLCVLALCLAVPRPQVIELSQAQFIAKFQSNLIGQLQVSYPPEPPMFLQEVRGTFYETDSNGGLLLVKGIPKQSHFHAQFRISDDLNRQMMAHTNYSVVTLNSVAQKVKNLVPPQ